MAGSSSQFVQAGVVNFLQQQGAGYIGSLVADGTLTEGSPAHAALHAIIGCAGAAASGQGCSSGALGAAAGSLLTNLFGDTDPGETSQAREARRNLLLSLVAGISTISGGNTGAVINAAVTNIDNNWLTKDERKKEKELTAACYFSGSGGNSTACSQLVNLQITDRQRNQDLGQVNAALRDISGTAADKLYYQLQAAQRLVCQAPQDCTQNADWQALNTVAFFALRRSQGIEAVYPEEWALNAVAGVGLTLAVIRTVRSIAVAETVVAGVGAARVSESLLIDARQGVNGASEVVARYGPMNQGPLLSDVANNFRSATYAEVLTQQPTTLYRVYGGSAGELGGYWTRTPPTGPVQSILDSALNPIWGNTATRVVKIEVPVGTRFYEGIAAPQGGLVGGGNQVLFPKDFRIDSSWIK